MGSRWRGAELLSCCVAGERRTQLGEERKELKVWQSFLLYRSVAGTEAAESDPAGTQHPGYL